MNHSETYTVDFCKLCGIWSFFFIFSYVEEPYANILRPGNPWGPISIDRMENRKSCDLMPLKEQIKTESE